MTSVFTDPADIVNDALVRVGWKQRIGSLYDGSVAAKAALDLYGQTRDELLRDFDWGFAERNVALDLQKVAPVGGYTPPLVWSSVYPILPWIYQFSYPDDCLKVRALRTTPVFIPNFSPQAVNFRIANDNSFTPAQKVILCNIANPILVYTAQVTNVATWEPSFVEALVAALATKLAPTLANLQTEQVEAADEVVETETAKMIIG